MGMGISMAAMMLPTAVPFMWSYGHETRRLSAIAVFVLIYAAIWLLIGLGISLVMSEIMLPASELYAGAALLFAGLYALMPWKRWAQARCQTVRCVADDGGIAAVVRKGVTYSACCVVCSAGVMAAVVIAGMSNLFVLIAAAGVMLLYKLAGTWPRRIELAVTAVILMAGALLVVL